jgi:hypothetical protein
LEKLDQKRIRELLQEADNRWFAQNPGKPDYQKHLDFTAAHIASNYHRPLKTRK